METSLQENLKSIIVDKQFYFTVLFGFENTNEGGNRPVADNLVIVESPAKAKTIEKYLGKRYKVVASMGHVRDLPRSQTGIDTENNYEPKYITIRGKGPLLKDLKKEAKKAKKIFLASDPDREGEAIAWHLSHALGDDKEYYRVVFNEITKDAVKESFKHPGSINQKLVDAQQAWKKVKSRAQSVALKMVIDRENEIREFKPEEYWTITGLFKYGKNNFEGKFNRLANEKIKLKTKEECGPEKVADTWDRFIASMMAPAILDTVRMELSNNGVIFRSNGQTIKFKGFMQIYIEGSDDGEEDLNNRLPEIAEGETVKSDKIDPNQHFTQPPPDGNRRNRLDDIAEGEASWVAVIDDFYKDFEPQVERADEEMEKIEIKDEPAGEDCEKCGSPMVYKMGRYGKFMACSNFPDCRNTKAIVKTIGVKCPKFYGCDRYPECDFISWDRPIGRNCPKCDHYLVETKKGKTAKVKCTNCDYEEKAE